MARQLISVCIFCFICATHSPCASHAEVNHEHPHLHQKYYDPSNSPMHENFAAKSREKFKAISVSDTPFNDDNSGMSNVHDIGRGLQLTKRDINDRNSEINNVGDDSVLKKLFLTYGDGETINIDGFKELVDDLNALHDVKEKIEENHFDHSHDNGVTNSSEVDKQCFNREVFDTLTNNQDVLNHTSFKEVCPVLLLGAISTYCPIKDVHTASVAHNHSAYDSHEDFDKSTVWLYSILSIVLISICGVLALAIIPVMQKKFYKPLIQFLVALAVGTLAGDALLHLLPHAMSPPGHDHHESGNSRTAHEENTWKGFVAMLGLTFFFIMERLILLVGKWRKKSQKHKHSHVKVINDGTEADHKNDTQCMDRYNPSPYCYKDIMNDPNTKFLESDKTAATVLELLGSNSEIDSIKKCRSSTIEKLESNELSGNSCTEANKMIPHDHDDYTVIVREHHNDHHGHSHKHGHVHAAPQNFSSVAWMVIMGDGLHNFTDGMAIGAAFSSGIAGGFSTTVAVLCHELPHELGDFAMLLKAGMSIKQALFYNLLSSILCIFGNIFGLWLGNTESANSWVFAVAAGTFIYIALVDMIPELSSAHDDEDNIVQCILHLSGLLLGVCIMTLIALYEHDLKHLFHESV